METHVMGRVTVSATLANWDDVKRAEDGQMPSVEVRRVEVVDARVDTGATYLALPGKMIRGLGLRPTRLREARTPVGPVMTQFYEPVQLTIEGRDCWPEVAEVDDRCVVLVGQLPLESLDFLVDTVKHRLIGNPDHDGNHMLELF